MGFRKLLFWMHLTAGCVAGAVVLLMSFTGVLLMYERQIIVRFDRGPFQVTAPAGARRMEVEALLAAVAGARALPATAALTLRSGADEPAEITLGREGSLFVNPYTGAVLGVGTGSTRAAFQKLRAWHRWLGVESTQRRATPKAITGACNLAFLFLVVSGAYLWIPRQWSVQHLRPVAWFRGGLSGRARDFNWHNTIGLWCLIPLLFVVAGAVPISYSWGGDLIYRLTGTEPQRPPAPAQGPLAEIAGLNALWRRAADHAPGWISISAPLRVPQGTAVTFTIDHGDGGQPQKRATLELAQHSGDVIQWRTFAANNAGQRLRLWSRFTHTGEAFGLVGQTIAGIASAGAVVLVWTGIALALRRLNVWRRAR
ncbi:MAG: PepSY-associated TM helix domain-containing protein [Bryobacteraceae bacterium]|nr:PepSY-associated TM helix domain-containing protein [Bryobacteraceae bacterium]